MPKKQQTKSRNKLAVPQAQSALNSMKAEVARELGVTLGADSTARQNGAVGGEITKRLVAKAKRELK